MRLADDKTRLTQIVDNTYVVRLIQIGEIAVSLTEDAAEVSLWICGSFGLKMAETKYDV